MPDHFQTIYATRAADYDRLIQGEDYQGHLLKAIRDLCPVEGTDIVEMGAGTGRLTRLLAPLARSIQAFDASAHMLEVASTSLTEMGLTNWQVAVADNRSLPVEDATASLAIEGWSFGHGAAWHPDSWRVEVGKMVGEMLRVLKPGGTAIVIETLGTGYEKPLIPTDSLAALYAWLEWERSFTGTWIRTDIRFESLDEAERLLRFFFADDLADRVVRENLTIVPECTGIWWRTKPR